MVQCCYDPKNYYSFNSTQSNTLIHFVPPVLIVGEAYMVGYLASSYTLGLYASIPLFVSGSKVMEYSGIYPANITGQTLVDEMRYFIDVSACNVEAHITGNERIVPLHFKSPEEKYYNPTAIKENSDYALKLGAGTIIGSIIAAGLTADIIDKLVFQNVSPKEMMPSGTALLAISSLLYTLDSKDAYDYSVYALEEFLSSFGTSSTNAEDLYCI